MRMLRVAVALCAVVGRVLGVEPTALDYGLRAVWQESRWGTDPTGWPVSFAYDGRPAGPVLGSWRSTSTPVVVYGDRTERTFGMVDPATGLQVRFEVVEFAGHPAVEWVARFENTGSQETPVIEAVQALDGVLSQTTNGTVLHYARGALCSFDDFQPLTAEMKAGSGVEVQAGGGRSSSDYLPFFNLAGNGGGAVIGLGWSGEWAAGFKTEAAGQVRVRAGQALTRLRLRPGESIRTPRVAVVFYQGGWVRGQNLWRRFVADRHRPRVDGRPVELPLFNGNWGGTAAADHLANIRAIIEHDLPVGYYWIDAEWFGEGPWFVNPGNWQVKADLYPGGFRPLSDVLHAAGRKLLLWFEPERVCEGTAWDREHPGWLLTVPPERRVYRWEKQTFPDWVKSESLRNQIRENDRLFDLGNPEARRFLTDFVSGRITEWGLDCYRHDANIAPLEFWRAADPPDRQGMAEIRWVEGLYAFWDELLRRHPQLLIDNCASGGRRIDLETLSRSVPLWRTDFPGDPLAKQCHTYGLAYWVPINSTGAVTPGRDSDYALRSSVSSSLAFGLFGHGDAAQGGPPAADFPFDRAKAALVQCRAWQRYFLGDYYPLTMYSKAPEVWMAWQFDLPKTGEGMVQAFRRERSVYESARFPLEGIDPEARYAVTDWDRPDAVREVKGRELIEPGLQVVLARRGSAAVFTYRRL